LNLGLCACKAGTLPLELHLWSIFCTGYFGDGGSHKLFAQTGFKL
jgi:hypothetical protein